MMASTKGKCLSFETKLKLIEAVDKEGNTETEICGEKGIAPSSLSTILKDSEKIRSMHPSAQKAENISIA